MIILQHVFLKEKQENENQDAQGTTPPLSVLSIHGVIMVLCASPSTYGDDLMSARKNTSNPKSKNETEHPCTSNGWPKKQIGKGVCGCCTDETCYKYNSVDRTPKPKKGTKRKDKDFEIDKFQRLLG